MERFRISRSPGFWRNERIFTKAAIVPVFPIMFTRIIKQMQTKIMTIEIVTLVSVATSSKISEVTFAKVSLSMMQIITSREVVSSRIDYRG